MGSRLINIRAKNNRFIQTTLWQVNLAKLLQVRWLGQFTDGLFQSALASFVLFSPERQPSATSAALAFSVVLLPYSLVGPYAGIFLDRFSRKRIVQYANAFRAITLLLIAILIKSGSTGVLLTLVVLVAFGANRLILSGLSAGLPLLVIKEKLITSNALAVTGGTIGIVIGGGVGIGLKNLLDRFHSSDYSDFVLILLAALSYLTASYLTSRWPVQAIVPHEHEISQEVKGWAEMAEGFHILRSHGDSIRGILATSIQRGGVTALTLMALLLERNTFHESNNPDAGLQGFATVMAIAGVGVGLGALIAPLGVARFGRHTWIRISLVASTPFLIFFALVNNSVTLVIAGFFIAGAGQSVKVTNDALLQAKIDDEYRGRTFAFYDVAVNGAIVSGAVIAAVILPLSGLSLALPLLIAALYLITATVLLRSTTFSGRSLPTT
jgi:MFS family permease